MDNLIIFCAQYLIYVTVVAAFMWWLTLKRGNKLKVAVYGFITGVIAIVLAKIGSSLITDPRPFVTGHVTPLFHHASDNGFPSDHTLLAFTVAMALFSVSKKWGIGFMVLAVIIGGARVVAGVHHWLDIGGSIVFVLLGYGVAMWLAPKVVTTIKNRRHKHS